MPQENRISAHVSPNRVDDADQQTSAVMETLKPQAQRVLDTIRTGIVKHPGAAVAIGVTIGVVLGYLVKRR